MPKERSMNPAAAQHKLDKQKSMKKGKADALARRNEKLARRNPDRIQRQINELKQMQESGQKLRPREQQILEALEKDLRSVQKAREALGDKAPKFNERGGDGLRGKGDGVLGRGEETTVIIDLDKKVTAVRRTRRYEGYPCHGILRRRFPDSTRREMQDLLRVRQVHMLFPTSRLSRNPRRSTKLNLRSKTCDGKP